MHWYGWFYLWPWIAFVCWYFLHVTFVIYIKYSSKYFISPLFCFFIGLLHSLKCPLLLWKTKKKHLQILKWYSDCYFYAHVSIYVTCSHVYLLPLLWMGDRERDSACVCCRSMGQRSKKRTSKWIFQRYKTKGLNKIAEKIRKKSIKTTITTLILPMWLFFIY